MKEVVVDGIVYVPKSSIKEKVTVKNLKATGKNIPFMIGEQYLLRGVTTYQVGRVKEIVGQWLVLEGASWVADTGRFHKALKNGFGTNAEIEPITGLSYLNTDAVMDAFVWPHDLPTKVK